MDNLKKGMPQIPATALSMMADAATAPLQLLEQFAGEEAMRAAPMGSSEQDRARRIAREMEAITRMGLTKDVPQISFKFVEKVAKDPFGLAAENAASKLFGLNSKPTKFENITGPLREDFGKKGGM
tara:strand:+ start:188 stop:565 length:378 start_codon:yes stop_codon:yes gene_type:complete